MLQAISCLSGRHQRRLTSREGRLGRASSEECALPCVGPSRRTCFSSAQRQRKRLRCGRAREYGPVSTSTSAVSSMPPFSVASVHDHVHCPATSDLSPRG